MPSWPKILRPATLYRVYSWSSEWALVASKASTRCYLEWYADSHTVHFEIYHQHSSVSPSRYQQQVLVIMGFGHRCFGRFHLSGASEQDFFPETNLVICDLSFEALVCAPWLTVFSYGYPYGDEEILVKEHFVIWI